jgi:hypothetical protein
MAHTGEVNPDLVRPSGFQTANDLSRRSAELLDPIEMRDRAHAVVR